jgi:hypothetical protein
LGLLSVSAQKWKAFGFQVQMTFKNEPTSQGGAALASKPVGEGELNGLEPPRGPVVRRNGSWARRAHAFLGVVSAFNLLLLISTGFLLQHASLLQLDEKIVPRGILPASYRPQDGLNGVRADIFVTDLHSGRLFGTAGALVLDGITLIWLTLLATGLLMYVRRQRAKQMAVGRNGNSEEDE